jgi:hypothetical protein
MGQASEHDRFPGPLFLGSLGLVGARSLANYTERRHTKCRDESAALMALGPQAVWLARSLQHARPVASRACRRRASN